METEVAIGNRGMAADIDTFDALAVPRLLAHQHGHVDAAAVIALDQVFLPVAVADHTEEISVFERLQGRHVVGFLQAEDVGIRIGDGKCGMLTGIVGMRNGARLLQALVFRLVANVEEAQHAILAKLVAKTREIETGHEIFDVERGEA